jgi:hypothetical protein
MLKSDTAPSEVSVVLEAAVEVMVVFAGATPDSGKGNGVL